MPTIAGKIYKSCRIDVFQFFAFPASAQINLYEVWSAMSCRPEFPIASLK